MAFADLLSLAPAGLWGRPRAGGSQGLGVWPISNHWKATSRHCAWPLGCCCRIEKKWHVCLVMRSRQISECTKTRNKFRHKHRSSREPSRLKVAGTGGPIKMERTMGLQPAKAAKTVNRARKREKNSQPRELWRILCKLKPTHTCLSRERLMSQLLWRSTRAEWARPTVVRHSLLAHCTQYIQCCVCCGHCTGD
jgi:hypothetical protein